MPGAELLSKSQSLLPGETLEMAKEAIDVYIESLISREELLEIF
jgi:hypothetical protein